MLLEPFNVVSFGMAYTTTLRATLPFLFLRGSNGFQASFSGSPLVRTISLSMSGSSTSFTDRVSCELIHVVALRLISVTYSADDFVLPTRDSKPNFEDLLHRVCNIFPAGGLYVLHHIIFNYFDP